MKYEWREIPGVKKGSVPFSRDGRIVSVKEQYSRTFALVELSGDVPAELPTDFAVDGGVSLDGLSYNDLQKTASALGIKGNQSKDDLLAALEERLSGD